MDKHFFSFCTPRESFSICVYPSNKEAYIYKNSSPDFFKKNKDPYELLNKFSYNDILLKNNKVLFRLEDNNFHSYYFYGENFRKNKYDRKYHLERIFEKLDKD